MAIDKHEWNKFFLNEKNIFGNIWYIKIPGTLDNSESITLSSVKEEKHNELDKTHYFYDFEEFNDFIKEKNNAIEERKFMHRYCNKEVYTIIGIDPLYSGEGYYLVAFSKDKLKKEIEEFSKIFNENKKLVYAKFLIGSLLDMIAVEDACPISINDLYFLFDNWCGNPKVEVIIDSERRIIYQSDYIDKI